MTGEVQMSLKMEDELDDHFMAVVANRHCPAIQIIGDLIRTARRSTLVRRQQAVNAQP